MSITATFGWPSEARTVRLVAGRVAAGGMEGGHLTSGGSPTSTAQRA